MNIPISILITFAFAPFLAFRTQGVKKGPFYLDSAVRPYVTKLYLINRDSYIVECFTDDVILSPLQ